MYGGELVAKVLQAQGVRTIFTLCGGHISPILVAAQQHDIRVVDTRHEATAVFAADAMARLSKVPGVAVVTAGPGATNTLTAIKNAQLAQSPTIILAGAPATALRGRGALQDVNLTELFKPSVKWSVTVKKVKQIVPLLEKAFLVAQDKVPGPVLIECPADLLYEEALVRKEYGLFSEAKSWQGKLIQFYLQKHVDRLFKQADKSKIASQISIAKQSPNSQQIERIAQRLSKSEKPLLLLGNQVVMNHDVVDDVVEAVTILGIPAYLTGTARGLLGEQHECLYRHKRKQALKEADLVLLAGVPCDFRLNYGKHIGSKSVLISASRSAKDLRLNCNPNIATVCDPSLLLIALSKQMSPRPEWQSWKQYLRHRDSVRIEEIQNQARERVRHINPLALFQRLDAIKKTNSIFVADGGDFVATASYILSPPKPLSWLDPGPYGTLGVGAGFALSAKILNPDSEVWIIFGDGALGYSLAEFDTFCRHKIPIIAIVGNDAGWNQVARDQVDIFTSNVGTQLVHTDYHKAAEALGAVGLYVDDITAVTDVLRQAQTIAASGRAVLINVILDKSDFRKGSMSM
ncbi:thiamine pyrophosphate-binding protein [Kaarinaea lacus]